MKREGERMCVIKMVKKAKVTKTKRSTRKELSKGDWLK